MNITWEILYQFSRQISGRIARATFWTIYGETPEEVFLRIPEESSRWFSRRSLDDFPYGILLEFQD